MENHDRAYSVWREAKVRERVLVHVDAHHDMSWMADHGSLSIANFICPALKEGVVREVYWVVPDGTWESRAGRAALRSHVRDIQAGYPGDSSAARWEDRRIRLAVLGRSLVICSLPSLPPLAEPVLLDVDTDYLMIPRVSYGEWDTHSPLPWRWPDELIASLRARSLGVGLVTVAYSVGGGHTPLQWKYLGAELVFRLRSPEGSGGLEPYEQMREGVVAQYSGDGSRAETAFRAVGGRLGAAPYFWLAHLLASQGRIEEGRHCYDRALALDPSYAGASTTAGVPLYFARAFSSARRVFRRALLLDSADACAHVGLGWLAADRKDWAQAERRARIALSLRPDLIDAHRLLGKALTRRGWLAGAVEAYERSLKLALAGGTPIDAVIVTDPGRHRMLDADHARVHAVLARLHARTGDRKRAISGYRVAIAAGHDPASVRFRLAWLYARQRQWNDTQQHVSEGLKSIPRAVRAAGARIRHLGHRTPRATIAVADRLW